MMPIVEEYRRSLKHPEAEEYFDMLLFRPVSFAFVKAIYRLPVTPNQLSVASMLAGLIAAWYFSAGEPIALTWGGIWYLVANVFDCSDGQLARLQNSGTLLGRVIDGIVDYVVGIAVFLGIGLGLAVRAQPEWTLVALVAMSSAVHAALFDRYQSAFVAAAQGDPDPTEREFHRFTREYNLLSSHTGQRLRRFAIRLYLSYLRLQMRLKSASSDTSGLTTHYYRAHKRGMRSWTFLGPTTNRTLLVVSSLAGGILPFLWIVITVGNVWLLYCLYLQRRIDRLLTGNQPDAIPSDEH